jgi:hypothetical protein
VSDRDFVFAFLRMAITIVIVGVVMEVIGALFKRYLFAVAALLDRCLPARVSRTGENFAVLGSFITVMSIVIALAIAANAIGIEPHKVREPVRHFFDSLGMPQHLRIE